MEIKRFETNERMSKVVLHNNTLYLCDGYKIEGSNFVPAFCNTNPEEYGQ